MPVVVVAVDKGSPAARAGMQPGDVLCSLAGQSVRDVLDYRFYGYDAEVELVYEREGAAHTVVLRKAEGADLGLNFETFLMDAQKPCQNHCVFCFVDQLPKGLRRSLYFKDDDARLSFLLGQYITLTNLSKDELTRICVQRISPLHISVHATHAAVRAEMMGNKRAGPCLALLRRLAAHGVRMHTQIVVCPGLNDGAVLEKTLEDLTALYPAVESVAVVPVGLTRHRENLPPLTPVDAPLSRAILETVERVARDMLAARGTRLVYASDELYLLAQRPVPLEEEYDGYPQLENGVGMLRLFRETFLAALRDAAADGRTAAGAPFVLVTGQSAARWLEDLLAQAACAAPGLSYEVTAVQNELFGSSVTVAGLLCGRDVCAALRGRVRGRRVFIPASMLRREGDLFLDDMSIEQMKALLDAPVIPVPCDGAALVSAIFG